MRIRIYFVIGCLLLSGYAWAGSAIDKLIDETGIRLGPVAMRDFAGWKQPEKIVVRASEELVAELRQAYPDIEIIGVESQDEAIANAAGADAVIGFCSQDMLAAARDAVWIAIFSAGADRCVPLGPVKSGKVVLTNMQKMSSPVLAEHAVVMMASLARGLIRHSKWMETGQWRRDAAGREGMRTVAGSRLLVIGLGGIGTEVARRGAALGMHVSGTRRSSREGPDFVDYVGLSSELHELVAEADFIVNALPLTGETRGVIDKNVFAAAKAGAFYVSIGRGATTVTDDLIAALESGHIAGAGLDVTDPEPLPAGHPLWQMENVIITPHISGTGGGRERHDTLLRENIRRYVAGDALYNVVDPERGY